MTIVPADRFSDEQLAALMTAGYEGYDVPMHVDAATYRFMVDTWDIDLARSRVVEEVGICNLGVRGDQGWIGGLGVVPSARRSGVGRALMEAVLDVAPPIVRLEVLEQNEPARRLYDELGFEPVRTLEVWSLTAEAPAATAASVEPRPLGQTGLPWQRADESLPAGYERLEVDGAAALVRVTGPRVSILQLEAETVDAAAELLAAARGRGESLHYVNVPAGEPASAALRLLGGSLDLRQLELERGA